MGIEIALYHHERMDRLCVPSELRGYSNETIYYAGVVMKSLVRNVITSDEYRSIVASSLEAFLLVDMNGNIIEANNSCCQMIGYTYDELLQLNVSDVDFIDNGEDVERRIADLMTLGSLRFESKHRRKDGQVIDVDASITYSTMHGGCIFSFFREITDRKKIDDALRESENRLRFALEGTNDGLWDVQMKTGKTYLSPRSYEILGYQPDEGAKTAGNWADLVHPDDLPLTNEHLKAHIEGRSPVFEIEQRLRMKSGDWKWVLSRGKVVTWDPDGKPLRITGTYTDLTVQKKLESQLHHFQKMESIGRLAGGVAHDFNNMLSVILGYTCLGLMEADPTQPLHSYLTEIHTAAERSAGLTQQLLTFARKQAITPVVLDLNDTVAGMYKMLQRLIGENIVLNWQPAANLCHVKVDPTQIDQILVNLCANARDAIDGAGKITIKTINCTIGHDYCSHHAGIVPGEYVLLVISDDGHGMDLETLPHIFEPFFTSKGIAEGTGLGLATVYGAVKLNNGFIYVDSDPGSGTTFSIYLPRHAGDAEQAKESAAETALGGQETIMLVDDEQAILDITTMFLTIQGYKVLQANSPSEATRLARDHEGKISLLITDVIMPEMNGKELANNLQVLYPQLKCLFMSGYTANFIALHDVLDEGVNFIKKPVSPPALANKVREILAGK
jgi:PAS domain S-box-containing protein